MDAALSSASERGLPFSVWTVSKLAEYCRGRNLLPPVTDEWVRQLRIHPVRTPTEASCINLIEAQFGVLKRFTVAPSADPTHAARRHRIDPYLRYRHRKLQNLRHPLHCIRSVSPIKLE